MCRDSSVGTATRNELDGTGIESQWGGGDIFCIRPHRPRGPNLPHLQWVSGLLRSRMKWPERGVDHKPST